MGTGVWLSVFGFRPSGGRELRRILLGSQVQRCSDVRQKLGRVGWAEGIVKGALWVRRGFWRDAKWAHSLTGESLPDEFGAVGSGGEPPRLRRESSDSAWSFLIITY